MRLFEIGTAFSNIAALCCAENHCCKSYRVTQGLQILLMSGVSVTSASQILESFWNIWSHVSQRKKPFSDFPAHGPGMYTLS